MRIWVTGIGVVSPLGRDAGSTMDALLEGRRAFGPVSLFNTEGCRSHIAAQIADLRVEDVAVGDTEGWSRTDAMSVLAAREALTQAGVEVGAGETDLILAGTTAGMFETEDLLAEMHQQRDAQKPLSRMLSHPLSATVDRLRDVVAPFRRARTICSACSGGANALILASSWLRTGRSERVLAGGADGLCRLTYTGFSCLGALSPDPCQPFDVGRTGLNLGEGAAFLLLETEQAARARGAEPLVELRGWAVGAEAHHITNPQASGETATRVMQRALHRAGLTPADIDYVNAHGTATPLNDRMESAALKRCLGAEVERIPVSSTKGQIGHTLGAAGAIEAAIGAMAIMRNAMPPTKGLEEVDPDCSLVHLREAREAEVRAVMSDSFGFGGSDAVIVLAEPGRFDDPGDAAPRPVFVTAAATVGALGVGDTVANGSYVEPGRAPAAGPVAYEAKEHLDLGRARRIDRSGRLSATVMQSAMRSAGIGDDQLERAGAIMGASFGAVDDCSAFIHRVYEKGARFASPAIFPNLLPSSPVAHASIYLRLRGPVFSSHDLGATSEGAMIAAVELIAAGEADTMLAGGVEVASAITERVLGPLCSWGGGTSANERSEGAAVLLFEAGDSATARDARSIAEVVWTCSWRGEPNGVLASLQAPTGDGRSAVMLARDDATSRSLLEGTAWADVVCRTTAARAGDHESAGGFAAAAAVSLLERGELSEALVLGLAPDRGYVLLLRATGTAS